jgi:hypothetical protein
VSLFPFSFSYFARTEPKGNYVSFVRSGNQIFLAGKGYWLNSDTLISASGHLPQKGDATLITGKVGQDLTVEEGYAAAKLIGLNLISTMQLATGDLNKVKRVVKLVGFVNCNGIF